ncbi:hypothetical protein SAMN05421686_102114 [Thalassolituus maritimus]|uniref:Microcystin-dependent protein n=2 Tax=Thalassolituus maritimus TaxID=484498 RepID=A0A1N7JMY6_9GAMM|nr:hypothetical protein SAMN05421686_102114 [Thalassolituus maritimus]
MRICTPFFLFTCIVFYSLSSGATAAPPRMVAFFPVETQVCPSGWSEYKPAKGYLIKGTEDAGLIGVSVGDPVQDTTAPTHRHGIKTVLPLRRISVNLFGGPEQRVTNTSVEVSGLSSDSNGGLSYVQYLMCEESIPQAGEPSLSIFLPRNSVQWFSGRTCPTGWETYKPLVNGGGRTILPLPRDAQASAAGAVVNGNDQHTHGLSFNDKENAQKINLTTVKEDKTYFANPFKTTNLASGFVPAFSDTSAQGVRSDIEAKNGNVLVPYTYLRPCVKTSKTVNIAELPPGMGSFTKGYACPTGLNSVTSAAGRFPLGLPPQLAGKPKPLSGTTFGADPLTSESNPQHLHSADIPVTLNNWGADQKPIIGPWRYVGLSPGSSKAVGDTEFNTMTFPYVQLKFCRVPG